jgi:uncharacterized protein YfkK (UPF0435 family)
MTLAQYTRTVINLDKDGIEHIKEKLDSTNQEILQALDVDNIETVIGQNSNMDIILGVITHRDALYVTNTKPDVGEMELYRLKRAS